VAKERDIEPGYKIDITEVTRAQYAAWLATNPDPATGQPSYCSWNQSFTPDCEWPPAAKGQHPVVCVDWCDAYAYCAGVGKRLCGKIGGGANGYWDNADATKSQWFNACSSNGANDYPYGDTYGEQTCNGKGKGLGTTTPVGSLSGCQSSVSGYAGVYDLSGNVAEWEDSCSGASGNDDICHSRGGAFKYYLDFLPCGVDDTDGFSPSRSHVSEELGFRCCAP